MTSRSHFAYPQGLLTVHLVILAFFVFGPSVDSSAVKITNNGYEGIVIAFSPKINQSFGEPLVNQIKELFTNASIVLHNATRHRAYFKDVTILVPQSWDRKPHYLTAGSEVFGEADIRVDDPNPEYLDGPYTLQPLGCGSEGLFIHLTPNYLRNLKNTSAQYFGDPGKTLVHEWAHLRYGIFDEFGYAGNPVFPMAYYDGQDLLPNACSNERLKGVWKDIVNDAACTVNQDTGMPGDNCVFLPDLTNNDDIQSSLASYHFLKNVFTFCDDGHEHSHNPVPQNKHNVLCESKSTWRVIEGNKDFQGDKNPPRPKIENLTPTFRVVQQMEATFCLVLDISGSMNTDGRRFILQEAVKRWLKEEVTLGTAVGVVTFSTAVDTVHPITKLSTEADRTTIINKIPAAAIASTRIGSGLQQGRKELNDYRKGSGGIIILVTDGEEDNTFPRIVDVIPELQQSQIRVVVIALHTSQGAKLQALAEGTGGKMFSVPIGAGAESLGMAFYEALTYQASEFDLAQKVSSSSFADVKPFFSGSFVIDSTIGNDTTVEFTSGIDNDFQNIIIQGPNVADDETKAAYKDKKLVQFKYQSLKEGTYFYTISRRYPARPAQIQVAVSSKARSATKQPIVTRSWIREEPNSTPQKPRFVILAEVKQGNNPVINAAVVAKVDRPSKESVMVQLYDNGNGAPDVTRNDGIYARYFTRFSGKGRYAVSAQVTDDGKASILEVGFTGSRSMPIVNKFQAKPNVTETETGAFVRESSSGSFDVTENIMEDTVDIFPPSRVSDFFVTSVSSDRQNVSLRWTAPGDDYDAGNASSYDIRYSSNWTELKNNFSFCQRLDFEMTPLPGGSEEFLNTTLPGLNSETTIYIALTATDKASQTSPVSNIVDVNGIVYSAPATTPAADTSTSTTTPSTCTCSSNSAEGTIPSVLTLLLLAVLLLHLQSSVL